MTHIIVNQDLCTRCSICAKVCSSGIIDSADEAHLPQTQEANVSRCLYCGHCEAFCPSQALLLNLPDEKVPLLAGASTISPEDMEFYLKKRRSVRHFTREPVPKEKILEVLDIARYAASGGNGQPVQWLVVHDPKKVRKIAELTIEWMKNLLNTAHPMSGYVPMLISAWEQGNDVICRGAPHLLFAHIPEGNPLHLSMLSSPSPMSMSLHRHSISAPAGQALLRRLPCSYEPLQKELDLPAGRKSAYAMMFGNPQYKVYGIPRRKPLEVMWQ